jgi:hypothetical protein
MTSPPRFSIGRVIGDAVSLAAARFFTMAAIAIIAAIPEGLLTLALLFLEPGTVHWGITTGLSFDDAGPGTLIMSILDVIVGLLTFLVIQAAITYAAFQSLLDERPQAWVSIRRALAVLPRLVLAMLWLMFLSSFVMGGLLLVTAFFVNIGPDLPSPGSGLGGFGAIALLNAAISAVVVAFFYVRWWVFVPTLVLEGAGATACFARSAALTAGRRWAVLAVIVLLMVGSFLSTELQQLLDAQGAVVLAGTLSIAADLFWSLINAVIAAVGYFHLRAEKEGYGAADYADVFS